MYIFTNFPFSAIVAPQYNDGIYGTQFPSSTCSVREVPYGIPKNAKGGSL